MAKKTKAGDPTKSSMAMVDDPSHSTTLTPVVGSTGAPSKLCPICFSDEALLACLERNPDVCDHPTHLLVGQTFSKGRRSYRNEAVTEELHRFVGYGSLSICYFLDPVPKLKRGETSYSSVINPKDENEAKAKKGWKWTILDRATLKPVDKELGFSLLARTTQRGSFRTIGFAFRRIRASRSTPSAMIVSPSLVPVFTFPLSSLTYHSAPLPRGPLFAATSSRLPVPSSTRSVATSWSPMKNVNRLGWCTAMLTMRKTKKRGGRSHLCNDISNHI